MSIAGASVAGAHAHIGRKEFFDEYPCGLTKGVIGGWGFLAGVGVNFPFDVVEEVYQPKLLWLPPGHKLDGSILDGSDRLGGGRQSLAGVYLEALLSASRRHYVVLVHEHPHEADVSMVDGGGALYRWFLQLLLKTRHQCSDGCVVHPPCQRAANVTLHLGTQNLKVLVQECTELLSHRSEISFCARVLPHEDAVHEVGHLDIANGEEVDQVVLELQGIQVGLVGESIVLGQLGADVHEAGHRAHLGGQEATGAGGLLAFDLLGVESGWLRHVCLEIVCINI